MEIAKDNVKEKYNELEQLKNFSCVVADTSDFELIEKYKPIDATTNPSLILKSIKQEKYKHLLDDAIIYAKKSSSKDPVEEGVIKLFVNFGIEILKKVKNRVSIEVDAKYSFDFDKSLYLARKIISLFEENGISREKVLIKLATTYEMTKVCEILEKENIHCNMTLLFSLEQAILASDAKATLISPFVGRILDWYKKKENKDAYAPSKDPGVLSVKTIYDYYKKFDIKTTIMGASFRNKEEILELSGLDYITISPNLLEELHTSNETIEKKLDENISKEKDLEKINLDEKTFRYHLNNNAMATEKLSEGIRSFEKDLNEIKDFLRKEI